MIQKSLGSKSRLEKKQRVKFINIGCFNFNDFLIAFLFNTQ